MTGTKGATLREPGPAAVSRALAALDARMRELEGLPSLSSEIYDPVRRRLRIAADHHSTAIEGNALTLAETAAYLLEGTLPEGKPLREVMEIRGHDDALSEVEAALDGARREDEILTEAFLLHLHAAVMRPEVEHEAATSGLPPSPSRPVGAYKVLPNSVETAAGTKVFTPPDETAEAMRVLLASVRDREDRGTHPVAVAAEFHVRFATIHPFYDGNGRLARLLTNLILRRRGYPEAIVLVEDREQYIGLLQRAESEGYAPFAAYLADRCAATLRLYLRCARGEPIAEPAGGSSPTG